MKKKLITILTVTALMFIALSATKGRSSSGAPASHTGAPGEQTCAEGGCHDDNKLNSGKATVNISLENNLNQIEAGKTYAIKIKISDANVSRFGFQIVALDSKTNENAGTFQISDSIRTQTVKNMYKLQDRNYVTYTFNGTDAVSSGNGEWTVNWTAPSTINKSITFFVGAVSANDDMSDKGDMVYTNSLILSKQK